MQRKTLISLFSVALLAATVMAPAVEAQRGGGRRGGDREGGGRGQFGGGRGGGGFGGGGFRGGPPGGGGSAILGLLRVEAVREEVKVTEDQQELVEILGDELREGRPDFPENFRDMSEEERDEFTEKMRKWGEEQAAQARETLKTILEGDQYKRLQEIFVQTQGVNALLDTEVVEQLKITQEQQDKIRESQEAQRDELRNAMREAFAGGGGGGGFDRDAMRERMETFRKESEEKTLAHLSAEQKTAFEGLKGEKFEMPERAFGFGGGRGGGPGGGRGDGGRGRRGGDRPQRPE